jgi:protoporphyrinogen oxidase
MVGGAQAASRETSEADLRERLPKQVAKLLGISSIEWLSLTRWREAIPQLKVGHHKVVAALDAVEASNPGLAFAGVDRGGIGVSDRVRLAREAVERVHRSVSDYKSVA